VPVTAGLVRCYSDYMYAEYGDLDSDYVFVNLWAGRIGAPMTYAAVQEVVGRIRARTGVDFTLHLLRHTHAIELKVVDIDVIQRLLGHASAASTGVYLHAADEDKRRAVEAVAAGVRYR
jgi:integrase